MTFEKFFCELISDEQWFSLLRHYKDETIRKAAEKVFAQLVADKIVGVRPMSENRKHVYNILCSKPGDKVTKSWHVSEFEKLQEKEKEAEAKQILTYTKEHADKCAAEALEIIRNSKMINSTPRMPHKQAVEEGGWLPKKERPWPMTTAMEAYNKERKIAYYRYCFDPITRDKLPTWMEEEAYNAEFDRIMIEEKKHPHWEVLREIK